MTQFLPSPSRPPVPGSHPSSRRPRSPGPPPRHRKHPQRRRQQRRPASPYGAPPTSYAPAPAAPPQGLAIASFICGIGGLLLVWIGFGLPASIAAVITGHLAQKRQPYARGFWITGLITGYVGILIGVVVGIFIIGFLIAVFSAGYYG